MKKDPLVSIVIPSYNGLPYLKEAILSVLAQDYPKIELIVLDDGSTDGTADFLKTYAGQFYFETQSRLGQAKTLNKGWQMCQGAIIGYLSADDKLSNCAVSESVKLLMEDERIILTFADNMLIDEQAQPIRKLIPKEISYEEMLTSLATPIAVGSFFRKSIFDALGGWNASYRQLGDLEYHLRLITHGTFKKIPKILGFHRVHELSASFAPMTLERADEYLRLVDDISQIPMALKPQVEAQAYLLSGRAHWRSGRYMKGLMYFISSIRCCPRIYLNTKSYRILLNALLNKPLLRCLKTYRMIFARFKSS